MSRFNNEGPTKVEASTITIPSFTTCGGCRYHDRVMLKSGMNAIYVDICDHPQAPIRNPFSGNLPPADFQTHAIHTPDWCPYLNPKENLITEEWLLSHNFVKTKLEIFGHIVDPAYHENNIDLLVAPISGSDKWGVDWCGFVTSDYPRTIPDLERILTRLNQIQ